MKTVRLIDSDKFATVIGNLSEKYYDVSHAHYAHDEREQGQIEGRHLAMEEVIELLEKFPVIILPYNKEEELHIKESDAVSEIFRKEHTKYKK